jgi:hypothetical protein
MSVSYYNKTNGILRNMRKNAEISMHRLNIIVKATLKYGSEL